jgi:ribA/ribD-fused uncharacterized protein
MYLVDTCLSLKSQFTEMSHGPSVDDIFEATKKIQEAIEENKRTEGGAQCDSESKRVKVDKEEEEKEILYFFEPWKKNGIFSNWSKHTVTQDGIVFKTAEHCFMYNKAKLMGDRLVMRLIVDAKTPREAKKYGRIIKPWYEDKWNSYREEVMFECILKKAQQHSDVRTALLESGDNIIAECSPYDNVWGTGTTRGVNTWRGLNLLGKQWMRARNHLRTTTAST